MTSWVTGGVQFHMAVLLTGTPSYKRALLLINWQCHLIAGSATLNNWQCCRLQLYKGVGISSVEVYEMAWKSVKGCFKGP